ncbi:WD40 repeat domain-containing protein [Flindersiella endophytica]
MTDLKDLLDAVADRAGPIDDLADRAVSGAIRRRRRAMIAAPLMAAAVAAAALLIPNQLQNRGLEPVRPTPTSTARPVAGVPQVDIRAQDQPALPARIDQPAVLAYATACTGNSCANPWRLLTADGKQWNVTGAAGNGLDSGAVAVAPNGKRIAYLSEHESNGSGYLVVRDLASGDVDRPLEFPQGVIHRYRVSISWSPDGRWLGIDYSLPREPGENTREAALVDTTTMATYPLSEACCLAGLPGREAGWLPLVPQPTGQAGHERTLRLNWSGDVTGELPAATEGVVASGSNRSQISPDGSMLATLDFRDGVGELDLVDTTSGEVSTRRRLDGLDAAGEATAELLGWSGPHTVLTLFGGNGPAGVYSIDVRDGTARLTYQLNRRPERLSVAGRAPAGGSR